MTKTLRVKVIYIQLDLIELNEQNTFSPFTHERAEHSSPPQNTEVIYCDKRSNK